MSPGQAILFIAGVVKLTGTNQVRMFACRKYATFIPIENVMKEHSPEVGKVANNLERGNAVLEKSEPDEPELMQKFDF